jgi:GNAT superfamily N-acetyltransferase
VTVRALRADDPLDVDLYREIRLRSLVTDPGAFASTHEKEVAFTAEDWRRRLQGDAEHPVGTFVDVEDGDTHGPALGTVAIRLTESDPHPMLIAMWVDPAARGRGVGRRLVEAALGWADDQQASEVMLWVVTTNQSAISLYRRCGFEPSGVVGPLPKNPCVDQMEMRRPLRLGREP